MDQELTEKRTIKCIISISGGKGNLINDAIYYHDKLQPFQLDGRFIQASQLARHAHTHHLC